jgi:tetraacyldisaccharide 4'-kinase
MSQAFRLALRVRDRLYRSGLLRTYRLDHPVISIGNLTLGGTGKTPLAIFLAEKLAQRGFRPVILSRGYRRRTRGTLVVSRGEGPLVGWRDAGDEPYLMAKRLAGKAAVVVGESRHLAGVAAQVERLGDVFLLDDGFQHRQLHRDVDIVTIDPDEWLKGELLLPRGRWREPKSAVERAHAACVQGDAELQLPIPQFRVAMQLELMPENWEGQSVTAFAGIAKPERFFAALEASGVRLDYRVPFPDHHAFTQKDLARLPGEVRITTEKDAVKLEGRTGFVVARASAAVANFSRLEQLILERIRRAA